jgi:hypothetical protein
VGIILKTNIKKLLIATFYLILTTGIIIGAIEKITLLIIFCSPTALASLIIFYKIINRIGAGFSLKSLL